MKIQYWFSPGFFHSSGLSKENCVFTLYSIIKKNISCVFYKCTYTSLYPYSIVNATVFLQWWFSSFLDIYSTGMVQECTQSLCIYAICIHSIQIKQYRMAYNGCCTLIIIQCSYFSACHKIHMNDSFCTVHKAAILFANLATWFSQNLCYLIL